MKKNSSLFSEEAEMAVIGAILLDSVTVMNMAKYKNVTASSFYLPVNKMLFREMELLQSSKGAVDSTMLVTRLSDIGKLDMLGGDEYLNKCIDTVVVVAHSPGYIETLIRKETARRMVGFSEDAMDSAKSLAEDPTVSMDNIVAKTQRALLDLNKHDEIKSNAEIWDSAWNEVVDVHNGKRVGIPSPWTKFNRITNGPRKGRVTMLAANRGAGKSSLVVEWLNFLGREGIPAADFAFEDGADITFIRRVACEGGFDYQPLMTGSATEDVRKEFKRIGDMLIAQPIYIHGRRGMDINAVDAAATHLKLKQGIEILFIDSFKDIKRPYKDTNAEDAQISSGLCDIAERLHIAVVVSHHIIKSGENKTEPINMTDIRGNARVMDDSRMVLALQQGNPPRLDCLRNSYGPIGHVDLVLDLAKCSVKQDIDEDEDLLGADHSL